EPEPNIKAWILTGPRIESTNEADPRTVRIMEKEGSLTFTFEPHSLTAIEMKLRGLNPAVSEAEY
ncbi:MAG: hypothetical protein PHC33_05650, partial [Candidatus Omnitrophica bacterium]|nr:hypothetical protein [Candidatus Omnitrophota bacterium]